MTCLSVLALLLRNIQEPHLWSWIFVSPVNEKDKSSTYTLLFSEHRKLAVKSRPVILQYPGTPSFSELLECLSNWLYLQSFAGMLLKLGRSFMVQTSKNHSSSQCTSNKREGGLTLQFEEYAVLFSAFSTFFQNPCKITTWGCEEIVYLLKTRSILFAVIFFVC